MTAFPGRVAVQRRQVVALRAERVQVRVGQTRACGGGGVVALGISVVGGGRLMVVV